MNFWKIIGHLCFTYETIIDDDLRCLKFNSRHQTNLRWTKSDLISSKYELLWKKNGNFEIENCAIVLQKETYSKLNSVVSKFDSLAKSNTLHSADLKESGRLLFFYLTSVSPFAVKKERQSNPRGSTKYESFRIFYKRDISICL